MLKQLLLVGLGGGTGSIFRFLVSKITFSNGFPWATLIVNLIGCFLIGLLTGIAAKNQVIDANMKLLLITGFCGGFTTFSAFSMENIQMFQNADYLNLALYLIISIVFGLATVFCGLLLSR
jgi:CrcB protein